MGPITIIHAMEWINPLVMLGVMGVSTWGYRRSGNRALFFLAIGLGIWALSSLTGVVYVMVANRLLGPPSSATTALAPVSNEVFLLANLLSLLAAALLIVATRKAVQTWER